MGRSCDEHSCADCLMFNWERIGWAEELCPCYTCSHGWHRGVEGAICKHSMEYDSVRIEGNKRFIAKHKHVLDK